MYLNWVTGDEQNRKFVEKFFNGVHEFKPEYRSHTKTESFTGTHPKPIEDNLVNLKKRFEEDLKNYVD